MKDSYNNYFKHSNIPTFKNPDGYKLQLKWDTRLWPVFLEQVATECNLPNFMRDFNTILEYAEANGVSLFTLYVAEKDKQNQNI